MTKARLIALFFAGAAAGAVAPRVLSLATSTRPGVVLDWQNAHLFNTRAGSTADGGAVIAYRACAYLNEVWKDGGMRRIGEPCWEGLLTGEDLRVLAGKMLAGYDGGVR